MWAALRSRAVSLSLPVTSHLRRWKNMSFLGPYRGCASLTPDKDGKTEILKLEEVEKVLADVKADDVRVIPVGKYCDWTDFMVFATGRSTWHVRNIAQALIYKAKQKQKGAQRMLLPSVEGQEGGKWIVIDSGGVIIHALDEKARAYYELESHWTSQKPSMESSQDLEKAMVKVRRKNNSKKKMQKTA
ncbi:hypothetical protein Nepgr_022615 [Nepenthes gracilis]|uniref:Protein Iojap-related, mitochondrial n=1 Tax=Nepenthes gracilis TaxID=150966 RepID=A0AAD3XX65_NEPGR|nr:hypothetical protein Nepgr_022615 [Nepenthes gracilis]